MEVVLHEGRMVVVVQVVVVVVLEISAILAIQVQVRFRKISRKPDKGTVVVDQHRFHRKGRCRSTFSCRFVRIVSGLRGTGS